MWKSKVDPHPAAVLTGSPTFYDGRLYVPVASREEAYAIASAYQCCSFRGSVVALDGATGKQIWKSYTISEEARPTTKNKVGTQLWGPSGAAIWSAPTVDIKRRLLYVTTGDNYSDPPTTGSDAFMAMDLESGKIVWSRQMTAADAWTVACRMPDTTNCPDSNGPDFDFGAPPILISLPNGRRALVAGQKSGVVHAVDPDKNGEVIWQTRVGKGSANGGVQWGMASDGRRVYGATSAYGRTRPTDPSDTRRNIVDPRLGGGLTALRIADGSKAWYAPPIVCAPEAPTGCTPAQSAAVTGIPGVVFSGSMDGHVRGYSAENGKIIWDFDTAREFPSVNGVKARGGSIDGPGAVVVNGMVFISSGYSRFGGMPGNVLLAFGADDK